MIKSVCLKIFSYKLSCEQCFLASPLRSLIGKKEGDIAYVEAPSGKKEFEILNISYG